jgi:hypothetical protein
MDADIQSRLMDSAGRFPPSSDAGTANRRRFPVRLPVVGLLTFVFLTQVPAVSAHGATATGGLSRMHGLLLAVVGIVILVAAVAGKRTRRVTPTVALYGVFAGIVVAALGAILFEGLSPDPTYSASTMPFPRSWYPPIALTVGFLVVVASFVIVRVRWPSRPRYAVLGYLLGLWIGYPYLVPRATSHINPIGYAIVIATPLVAGYIIWKDVGEILRAILRDRVATGFGIGVGLVMALFFITITGYLSFFPEEGIPHDPYLEVLPTIYQLVMWPTLEVGDPHIPFFLALSPGQLIVVGTLSALIGLNAAVIARHWRVQERAGFTQGTAGSAAIVGTCTCGCCGPLIAKVAVVAAGPAIAAPLYWVFVDSASPLSAMFIVGSLLLFVGSLIYSVGAAHDSPRTSAINPAD